MRWRGGVGRLVVASTASLAAIEAWGRGGGGNHSVSVPVASGSAPSGPSIGGGSHSAGGFIGFLIVVVVLWLIYRRFNRSSGTRPDSPGSDAAREVMNAALGAAGLGALAAGQGRRAASGGPALPAAAAAAIDAIRARDPDFELETFMQRAEMTFFLVKRAMQRNDAAGVRPYVGDALFAAVSRDIAQMTAQHRHAFLESLNVRAVHLLEVACTDQSQTAQVHFDLVYRGKTLDDANRVLGDEGEDRAHGERWTFQRAAAARTPVSGGVTASRCPACGAELKLSLDGACTHCKASVTNGSVDWVVTGVEQAPFVGFAPDSGFAVAAPTVAEGIASLTQADPAFSVDAFRSRVSTAFLALQDAWCRQNLETGRAFLSQGAYFAWRAQLESMAADGRRNVMEQLTVTAIEPIQVVHGRVFDDLKVRISAACADYEIDAQGKIVFGDRNVRPFTEDWTFQRSVGVPTSGKPGTLENTCPRCGAPVALTQIGECRYCKAAVTSGKFDWVVSRIEQEDAVEGGAGPGGDLGANLALQVGGAIVGGLLGSLLSGRSSDDADRDR